KNPVKRQSLARKVRIVPVVGANESVNTHKITVFNFPQWMSNRKIIGFYVEILVLNPSSNRIFFIKRGLYINLIDEFVKLIIQECRVCVGIEVGNVRFNIELGKRRIEPETWIIAVVHIVIDFITRKIAQNQIS